MLAFEGAEGFGAQTVGGRGGTVVRVTNLDDSGTGSLRWALETMSGPRTVIFDVSGTIQLKSQIMVQNPYVTIAGQTSPDGIAIEGARIRFKAGEAIVQGLEFRPGDGVAGQAPGDRDGIFIGTTDHVVKNVIIDHNSFTWATDENLTINGRVQNVTVSNNIIAEGLSKSLNPKGEHSKGMLISNWGLTDPNANGNITVTKNLFAHNMDRNPEVRAGQNIEIINNYIYDPGRSDRVIAVGGGNSGTLDTSVAVIGNVIDSGLSTAGAKAPINLSAMGKNSSVYLQDNVQLERAGLSQTALVTNSGGAKYLDSAPEFSGSGMTILGAAQVANHVLTNAGADPFARNATDARIVQSVIDGTGTIINGTAGVKVAMTTSAKPAADTDKDGMPDWFETRFGLNAKVADNNGDSDRDGYTNLEEYIQGMLTGFKLAGGKAMVNVQGTAAADVFTVSAEANAAVLRISGFDTAKDKIDLSGFLSAYKQTVHTLSDFVEVTKAYGNTIISIDRDGSGTAFGKEFVAEIAGIQDAAGVLSAIRTEASVVPRAAAPSLRVETPAPADSGQDAAVNPAQTGTAAADTIRGGDGSDVIKGGGGDDKLYGKAGNDYLFGDNGNDWLDGGEGDDFLTGGAGNDTYMVGQAGDVVAEMVDGVDAGGIDTVRAFVSYTLTDGVENLTLFGSAAIDGAGNSLNNVMVGNAAANRLSGGAGNDQIRGGEGNDTLYGDAGNDTLDGGLGIDFMAGGDGDDTYAVDNLGDVVLEENVTGGVDSVQSSVRFALGANLEKLTLTGTHDIAGEGNAGDNMITGNSAANRLSGADGRDTLRGGNGNDQLFGGAGDDILDGGADNDFLFGGAGADRMIGGAGADTFQLGGGGADTIADFSAAVDRLALDDSLFAGLRADATGALQSDMFMVGERAVTADQHIIYNNRTGALMYDADGSGSGSAETIAFMAKGLALTSDHFMLI